MNYKRIKRLVLIPILVWILTVSSVSAFADTEGLKAGPAVSSEDPEIISGETAENVQLNNESIADPGPSEEESGDALPENADPEVSEIEADPADSSGEAALPDGSTDDSVDPGALPDGSSDASENSDAVLPGDPEVNEPAAGDAAQENAEPEPLPEEEEEEGLPSKTPVTEQETAKEASVSAEGMSFGRMTRYGTFYFNAGNMTAPGGVKSARVAVWCEPDKSDKKWYKIDLTTNQAECNVSNHQYHFGEYTAKLFITDASGEETYAGLCKKEYLFEEPSCTSISMSMDSIDSMNYTVAVSGVRTYCGIRELKAAVWSTQDQSDLIWNTSYKNLKSGNFSFYGSLVDHGYRQARYTVHLYLVDNNGNTYFLGGIDQRIKIDPGTIKVVYDPDTNKAKFTLPSIKHYDLLDHVEYSVWKDDGNKDDLKTYSALLGSGKFQKTVSMLNFSGNGDYKVSCCGVTKAGTRKDFGEASFKVTNIPTKMTYELTRISNSKVSITIRNANINGVPADSVKMPTWSNAVSVGAESNQDDIVWYEAVKNADGSFTATINRNLHKSSGKFSTHIYAYAGSKSAFCYGYNYDLYRTSGFSGRYMEVARKSILAVESGGQVYGNARYDAFAPAYSISSSETGITIGAGQWMGSRAVKLLFQIRDYDPVLFKELAPLVNKDLNKLQTMDQSTWAYYGSTTVVNMSSGSKRAAQIKAVLTTEGGISIQNALIESDLYNTAVLLRQAGVKDVDAVVFLVNVAHLGGTGAAYRIMRATAAAGLDYIVEDLWSVMLLDQADTSSSNQVGDALYQSRHLKVIGWIYEYLN